MRLLAPVRGMHCASCVKTVEDAARTVPGVREASVNLAAEEADVEVDPCVFRAPRLQQALRDRGFRLHPRRLLFRVTGLDPSGVAALEDRLRERPGVLSAAAHALQGTVAVDLLGDEDVAGLLRQQGLDPRPEELAEADTELRGLAWRAAAALLASAVLMTLMLLHRGPHWLWALIAAPVHFGCGWPFHAGLLASLRHRRADMNTLVSLGTNVAFFASPFVAMPYYDTSVMIIAVVLLGRLLERRARRGGRRAVEALLELAPRQEAGPGEERLVKPGERFPADGVVLDGSGAADESMLTGESLPVDKRPGDRVLGGTLNRNAALRIRVERALRDGLLGQVIEIVRRSQSTKPAAQRLADVWAARFVPIVLLLAALTAIGWWLADPARLVESVVAVLVVACPCAFGLATPMAVVVASGRAARLGLLFKDAAALESAARLVRVVFDKTGTLTQGRPVVTGIHPVGRTDADLLALASAVERGSEHPLARAVVERAGPGPAASSVEAEPGWGVSGIVDGRKVAVVNRAWLDLFGIEPGPLAGTAEAAAARGETPAYVVLDGSTVAGLLTIADAPRPEAARVVADLKARGLAVSILSGDGEATVRAVASRLGVDEIRAGVSPGDKAAAVRDLQAGGPAAMVGDGINDAPALAQADLGVALHHGTDAAMESADVILMRTDLSRLVTAIDLARATRRVIRQNFAWAFGYNALLLPAAAGLLAPWGLTLDPMLAAVAMAISSLTVIANSLRLARAGS